MRIAFIAIGALYGATHAKDAPPSTEQQRLREIKELGEGFIMIRGASGHVLNFHHQGNEFGNHPTKQSTMNRATQNQRFILDSRTKSIRSYHLRNLALTM